MRQDSEALEETVMSFMLGDVDCARSSLRNFVGECQHF